MSTHGEESDQAAGEFEDLPDDTQLVIRIPNPKVYMARQSRWVGRRGKPRCDHCRVANLKCDRVLPICNHCSWEGSKECKYTPLPTPAHRGIPRCDRCRIYNVKCDRNLPICNNCKECPSGTVCNYTPKKRQKAREDDSPSVGAGEGSSKKSSFKPSAGGHEHFMNADSQEDIGSHTFYGQNVATFHTSLSPTHSETESPSEPEISQTGRFTADWVTSKQKSNAYSARLDPASTLTSNLEVRPHVFANQPQKITLHTTHFEPWRHPSFIPLPEFVYQFLNQVDLVEIPKRLEYENALLHFLEILMEPLRETAAFPVDKYKKVARALQSGDTSPLSERLRFWVSIHRVCSGSDQYNVILVPRDSVAQMDATTAERYRHQFVADLLSGSTDLDSLQAHHYDRIPVLPQIYDILTYAHRGHLPADQMLVEIVRLRVTSITWPMAEMYVKMCPLCVMRQKKSDWRVRQKESASPSPA